jgi:hypothetical protein
MARTKKHKHWQPNTYEKILLAITIAVALICTAVMAAPMVASFGADPLPHNVPLVRTFPFQP